MQLLVAPFTSVVREGERAAQQQGNTVQVLAQVKDLECMRSFVVMMEVKLPP